MSVPPLQIKIPFSDERPEKHQLPLSRPGLIYGEDLVLEDIMEAGCGSPQVNPGALPYREEGGGKMPERRN